MNDEPATVLAVDDASVNLQLIATVLKDAGFQVLLATSGAQALAIARSKQPDCILLDVMMPEMDGFDVCRRLKSDDVTRMIPVIFLTALSDTESVTRGFEVGGVDYVPKPFRRPELVARVRTHVQIRRMTETLRLQSVTDGLTGLQNHQFVVEQLEIERERSSRYSQPLSVIMMDVDHFKRVNDNYGHTFGDEVLRGLARIIRSTIRDIDFAGRYGGEEFMIVLPNTPLEGGRITAERIRAAMNEKQRESAQWPTVSAGIAEFIPGESLIKLVNRADELLYEAKHLGRNRVVIAKN